MLCHHPAPESHLEMKRSGGGGVTKLGNQDQGIVFALRFLGHLEGKHPQQGGRRRWQRALDLAVFKAKM